jgi:heme/copper-type cytochrome/quinol oxidase subunit 2
MSIIKNPIVLAIVVGVLVFVLMSYFYKANDSNKKKKSNKKKNKGTKETTIIVAVIASLSTWYIAYCYFDDNTHNSDEIYVDSIVANNSDISHAINQKDGNKNPHISSDDPTRSYNLIGSGLNIPRSELKIPNVLIDYN